MAKKFIMDEGYDKELAAVKKELDAYRKKQKQKQKKKVKRKG